ncbi:MAG: hypothetical protein AB7I42_26575 [Bradyrhizobium sp.]|uniref:hypothetical protein n=1 Tax=Bradyrhizobium sp. TaxID=376 RepID=UPI003D0BB37B
MTLRPVVPLTLPNLEPAQIGEDMPELRAVDPRTLLIDESYQRGLSERSVRLIRRIVNTWGWTRFKPPVVAETDKGLHVIDGQHTAIAAVTHGGLATIPVLVVKADTIAERAQAFIGHNVDRITVTPQHLHVAAVAAGDETALTIEQVCERAGVKLLRSPPSIYRSGESIALSTIKSLVKRRTAQQARIILQILADAKCAPVTADQIKAVELLLHGGDYAGELTAEQITLLVRGWGAECHAQAREFSLAHRLPMWRALAVSLFRAKGKLRGHSEAAVA